VFSHEFGQYRLEIGRPSTRLSWFWCRSEAEPIIGWVSSAEDVPLVRHDATGWESIADQVAAKAVPVEKPRRTAATTIVVGKTKAPRVGSRQSPPGPHAGGGGESLMMPAPRAIRDR
jgi:hypothetical protein